MKTYETQIPTPDVIRDLVEALTEQCEVVGFDTQHITIRFEAEDEWELHEQVMTLQSDLEESAREYGFQCGATEIPRPTLVKPSNVVKANRK